MSIDDLIVKIRDGEEWSVVELMRVCMYGNDEFYPDYLIGSKIATLVIENIKRIFSDNIIAYAISIRSTIKYDSSIRDEARRYIPADIQERFVESLPCVFKELVDEVLAIPIENYTFKNDFDLESVDVEEQKKILESLLLLS